MCVCVEAEVEVEVCERLLWLHSVARGFKMLVLHFQSNHIPATLRSRRALMADGGPDRPSGRRWPISPAGSVRNHHLSEAIPHPEERIFL